MATSGTNLWPFGGYCLRRRTHLRETTFCYLSKRYTRKVLQLCGCLKKKSDSWRTCRNMFDLLFQRELLSMAGVEMWFASEVDFWERLSWLAVSRWGFPSLARSPFWYRRNLCKALQRCGGRCHSGSYGSPRRGVSILRTDISEKERIRNCTIKLLNSTQKNWW